MLRNARVGSLFTTFGPLVKNPWTHVLAPGRHRTSSVVWAPPDRSKSNGLHEVRVTA